MSLDKLQDLKGRAVLVTGGSRGLGLEIPEALGERDAAAGTFLGGQILAVDAGLTAV